ncbi:glycosyltransferase [Polaribacter sp. Z014]|uniref:glycosyltransferase family 2 protein n=1 Tax=Polaribacter sp. Z014 TaxID=2927126 RepID=UPI0020207420|nr:glycosyltransferase [Polaribacter sp. Z014]MCL7764208.1 glycosyltransferase [Polaribacter sp. Z014]
MIKFSIVITTYNRLKDLKITLKSLENLIQRNDVELVICDDYSTDGTQVFLKNNYIKHTLILNKKSRGLIYNRNILNSIAKGNYIISLDDDAQFLSENILEEIEKCFLSNLKCGVQSLRIFWGKEKPSIIKSIEEFQVNKGFVGCGHVWRKSAWESIVDYPSWFIFYGEEDFASFQLFKKGWDILYNPNILVHHRVDIKSRKKEQDYRLRLRRSFRSGWYLYFLFYPLKEIPRRLSYTLWQQIKLKTFKGDFKATIGVFQAILDVIYNFPKLLKNANRLTVNEFKEYQKLPETKLYWKPEKKS